MSFNFKRSALFPRLIFKEKIRIRRKSPLVSHVSPLAPSVGPIRYIFFSFTPVITGNGLKRTWEIQVWVWVCHAPMNNQRDLKVQVPATQLISSVLIQDFWFHATDDLYHTVQCTNSTNLSKCYYRSGNAHAKVKNVNILHMWHVTVRLSYWRRM